MDRFILEVPRNPIVAVGLPLAMGWASGLITQTSVKTWYPTLRKPAGEPPRLAFPIAWTTLYASMGYASHLLAKAYQTDIPGQTQSADLALRLYWASLVLNGIWTPTFFGLKEVGAALVDIVALTGTTYALTYNAQQADSRTIYLLAPYCLWLSYATYLNAGIYYLNFWPGSWSRKANTGSTPKKDL